MRKVALATHQPAFIILLGSLNPCGSLPEVCWGARKASWMEARTARPPRGEDIGQFTGRRNGGSLGKATVTLVDSFKYCWAGTSNTMPGWLGGRVSSLPCPRWCLTAAKAGQGLAGMDPARHRACPASGQLVSGGCRWHGPILVVNNSSNHRQSPSAFLPSLWPWAPELPVVPMGKDLPSGGRSASHGVPQHWLQRHRQYVFPTCLLQCSPGLTLHSEGSSSPR